MKIKLADYDIVFGNIVESLSTFLKDNHYTNMCIIVDSNTRKLCLPLLHGVEGLSMNHVIEVEPGELHKNIQTATQIWQRMLMGGMDRGSLAIMLGGGVVCDMGGFCAVSYMRGIDFIHIPTTLLSQVDASVGGKLAVDLQFYKNIVGFFKNPKGVFIDVRFLETLGQDQIRSGWAEVFKHGLIHSKDMWDAVTNKFNEKQICNDLLLRSIEIKNAIVQNDPTEQGIRKILNFGHTVGHAIETLAWKKSEPILHGEAIFIGMVCESYIAYKKNMLKLSELEDITDKISSVYYNKYLLKHRQPIISIMKMDKKNERKALRMSLLECIGTCAYNVPVSFDEVLDSFSYYSNLPYLNTNL